MHRMNRYNCFLLLLLSLLSVSCRKEMPVIPSDIVAVTAPKETQEVEGFYLLNEGNMGSNKSTLDYFDYNTGEYHRNIYAERNPNVVKELGDVGNDISICGKRLFAVINASHMVEVMDARYAVHIGTIPVTNCRYVTFHNGKVYISSYAGPILLDPNARPGKVVEVDAQTLKVEREVVVGYQPEEMAIVGNKLYVANSGGYRFPNYDRTVSVVDLEKMEVIKTIDVAINLHHIKKDRHNNLYVTSRGDYKGIGSDVYKIDTGSDRVVAKLGFPASNLTISGDSLYAISTEWSHKSGTNEISYTLYDLKKEEVVTHHFITDGTDSQISIPYGIAINPESREILITDATDYVTPGYLFCYSPEGRLKWKVRTGDIPAHFAFVTRQNIK